MLGLPLVKLLGEVCEANVFEAHAFADDPVVERNAGCSASLFTHFERRCCLLADIQSLGVAIRREEDVILGPGVNGLRKSGLEDDRGGPIAQRARAEVLESVLRRLHGVERDFARAAVDMDRVNHLSVAGYGAADINRAFTTEAGSESLENRRRTARCGLVVH